MLQMGGNVAKPIQDGVSAVSPWNTQIVIDNQVTTPVRVFLARNSDEPSVDDAVEHKVPPQKLYAIGSGWLKEPRATLIVRVAVHEAKVFRMSNAAHLKFELEKSGLKVSSSDDIIEEEYPDPGSVPNIDTVPMVMRGESFMDRKPEAEMPRASVAREAMSAPPPGPQATVHGKASESIDIAAGIDINIGDNSVREHSLDATAAAAEATSTASASIGSPAAEAAEARAMATPDRAPCATAARGESTSPLEQLAAAAVADTEASPVRVDAFLGEAVAESPQLKATE